MVNTKLIAYIKTEEAKGYQAYQLHDFLIKKGFAENEVDEAIAYANKKDITTLEQQAGFANALPSIKRRNSVLIFLLTLFTFGIYGAVWYVRTVIELHDHQQHAPTPLWGFVLVLPQVVLFFIILNVEKYFPLYLLACMLLFLFTNLLAYTPYTRSLTRLTGGNSGILLSLLILAPPFGVLAMQEELNSRAHYKRID